MCEYIDSICDCVLICSCFYCVCMCVDFDSVVWECGREIQVD